MCYLSWQILIYGCRMGVHDLQHPRCPASDILILFGTRNNFTFSGIPALLLKCYVILQCPLHLWSQMAINDLYFFFWDTTWNSLCRPEFLLWRTALWKWLVQDNFQHVSSGTHDSITPRSHHSGAGFGGGLSALRAASEQVQCCCCGTWAALSEGKWICRSQGRYPRNLHRGVLRTQEQLHGCLNNSNVEYYGRVMLLLSYFLTFYFLW